MMMILTKQTNPSNKYSAVIGCLIKGFRCCKNDGLNNSRPHMHGHPSCEIEDLGTWLMILRVNYVLCGEVENYLCDV